MDNGSNGHGNQQLTFTDLEHQKLQRYLKEARVWPFTKSPDFAEALEDVFQWVRDTINSHRSMYSHDFCMVGLPGLAVTGVRKSARLYDYLVLDTVGKDKIEDEVEDNLMGAIYIAVYYRMLLAQRTGDLQLPLLEVTA